MRDRLNLQARTQTQTQMQGQAPGGELHIPLIWFCGLHVDKEDEERSEPHSTETISWPATMFRSFIAQLLRYYPHFNLLHIEQEAGADIIAAREGKLKALWKVFHCLVRRLPGSVTLVCVIDGVVQYEMDRYEDAIMGLLKRLLGLGKGLEQCRVKVLVVSPTKTESVRLFEGDGEGEGDVLSLAGEPVGMGGFEMGVSGGDLWIDRPMDL